MKKVIVSLIAFSFFCVSSYSQDGEVKKGSKKKCKCIGNSFDTCCKAIKVCCETKFLPTEVPGTVVLQKNFADNIPFSFDYFTLKKKKNLCIRICNINRLAYDITAKGEIVKADLPDTNLYNGLAKIYQSAPAIKDTANRGNFSPFNVTYDVISTWPSPKNKDDLESRVSDIKRSIQTKAADLATLLMNLKRFSRFVKNVPVIIGSECCSQQKIKDLLGNQIDIKILHPGISFNTLSDVINTDVPLIFDNTKDLAKEIKKQKQQLKNIIEEYRKDKCKREKSTSKKGNYEITKEKILPNECKILDDLLTIDDSDEINKALDIVDKSNKDDLLNSISAINDMIARVNNDNNFFYTTCFDKDKAEFIDVIFKAIPKDAYKTKLDSQVYQYRVPVLGLFKWAIGPSLNFHFGGTLVNRSYSLDSARNTAGTIMKDTFLISRNAQRSRVIPYVGFMAHFYWQMHSVITPAITIGLSTSPTQLSDLRAYLGGSVIIGGPLKGKVIFSAGLSGAAVDRLKSNLIEGPNPKNRIIFNGNNLPSSDQLVDKVFRIGFFFGMSYNLKD